MMQSNHTSYAPTLAKHYAQTVASKENKEMKNDRYRDVY